MKNMVDTARAAAERSESSASSQKRSIAREAMARAQRPDEGDSRPERAERGARQSSAQSQAASGSDDPWLEVEVRLPPKDAQPAIFRLLRPTAVLAVGARAYTKVLLQAIELVDTSPDDGMLEFRHGYHFTESISATRLVLERSLEWQIPLFFAQVGFAQAYGSFM